MGGHIEQQQCTGLKLGQRGRKCAGSLATHAVTSSLSKTAVLSDPSIWAAHSQVVFQLIPVSGESSYKQRESDVAPTDINCRQGGQPRPGQQRGAATEAPRADVSPHCSAANSRRLHPVAPERTRVATTLMPSSLCESTARVHQGSPQSARYARSPAR